MTPLQTDATVILLFADALSAPEVYWDLCDAGFRVVCVARAGSRPALRFSRRSELAHVPDPATSVSETLEALHHLVEKYDGPVVMPLDDQAVWLVRALEGTVPMRVCGPTAGQAELTLDKRFQLWAAARAGFNVPETLAIAQGDDLHAVQRFPCVVKPALAARVRAGALGRGRGLALRDSHQRDQASLSIEEPLLVQPHIQGVGEGVFGLAIPGKVVAWSGHRRVRMLNPAGSGSSACRSHPPDDATIAAAERFVAETGWRGLFMIELLRDQTGRLWFMELNGRPWGSMALALRSGLRYPAWAVQSLLDPTFVPTPPAPRPDLLCRHMGRELVHLAFVARGPKPTDIAQGWPSLRSSLRAMLEPRGPQALYNWRRNDPLVFFADVVGTVRPYLASRARSGTQRTSILRRLRMRASAIRERVAQAQLQRKGLADSVFAGARSVLFVCYGNINRSALAERHLRQLVGAQRTIHSCGFHPHGARSADPEMVSVASEHGVDLSNWTSRVIDAALVQGADVIFAMEACHLVQLYESYPEVRGKAYLLGAILPGGDGPLEIRDPFGRSRRAYEKCVTEVAAATSVLAKLLCAVRLTAP